MSLMPEYSDAPPPSYESLFGKIKKAKQDSNDNVTFAKTTVGILFTSVGCTICMLAILAIPVTNIVIGSLYLHECPAQRMIPIYLIVFGVFGVLQDIFGVCKKIKGRNEQEEDGEESGKPGIFTGIFSCLVGCFLTAWFIAGNVWIYSINNEWSSNTSATNYCHPTLYYYAFWITTSMYIILGLSCCLACVGGCIAACLKD